MAIPSVIQGLIEVDEGKVFELDSPRGAAWLESIGSFRYEPSGDSKAYTVRKEPSGYWYGCRKIAGTVRKKYIGKTSEITTAKLDEIAVALEDAPPPVSRVKKVAEVAQEVAQVAEVAERVTQVAQDRLTALELEVANLRKALEALQEALPGKSEAGDSEELPKVDSEVAEGLQNEVVEELHNDLGNLKIENETLRQELSDARAELADAKVTILNQGNKIRELERGYSFKPNPAESRLRLEIGELRSELAELKQKSAATSKDLPEAADLLNQLKSKRKKSKTDLADVETLLEILELDTV
jgi:chromosome segregation ATPase